MDIETAKTDVDHARSRLEATVKDVRDQLTPKAIATRLLRLTKKQSRVALIGAASSPKTRPVLALGMIAAGTAYLFRKPIFTALVKRLPKETHDDE